MKREPEIGMEYPIKGEDEYIYKIAHDLIYQLDKLYAPGESKRQAHPKMHALLDGEFTVEENLPEELQVGIFKTPKTYPCKIRISSSSTKMQDDVKKDVRGFAIKVQDVPGEKLITSYENNDAQDFLLVSMPTFPIANVHQFQKLLTMIAYGKMKQLILPWHWGNLMVAMRLKNTFIKTGNLLQIPFWSTVPYQFGDVDRAVKYMVKPQKDLEDKIPKKPGSSYLREAIIKTLGKQEVLYDFMVQFQEDPVKMPIENASKKWKSPFTKVATLKILKKYSWNESQNVEGQNYDFSPWHSLPEHRPIGGMNRARRIIYHSMSSYRRWKNGTATYQKEHQEMETIS